MIDLTLWTARIAAEVPALAGQVFDAAEAWRSAEAPPQMPAVYVGPYRDAAHDAANEPSRYVQDVDAVVSVMLVVAESVDTETGIATMGDLQAFRRTVAKALLRWRPNDAITPVSYDGGSMVQWVTGKMQWADRYRCRYLIIAGEDTDGPLLKHVTTLDDYNRGETIKHPDGTITQEEFPP